MSNQGEEAAEEELAELLLFALEHDDDSINDAATAVSFDNLIHDCLVHILSFLNANEMNDATFINSAFREARNADSLDQTRTATITIKTFYMSIDRLLDAIEDKGWTRFFSEESNYKCLKFVRAQPFRSASFATFHGRYGEIRHRLEQNPEGLLFQSVSSLDLSQGTANERAISAITLLFPNVQQVDLSYVNVSGHMMLFITSNVPNLKCIKCNGSSGIVCIGPCNIHPQNVLLEVLLDDAMILGSAFPRIVRPASLYSDLSETESYLFMQCHRLERVSMKNTTFRDWGSEAIPVPQDMLIKLVRYHPTLRWLRSDLTDENIAMLKQERPHVTLINN